MVRNEKLSDRLDDLVEKLREAHGDNLASVVLYGSAAAPGSADLGEEAQYQPRDTNLLVVLNRITPADLRLAHSAADKWRETGNPLPLYFTREEIDDSSDVFPMEFIDFSRAHRVLYGPDPFSGLQIATDNLRHQLEYELRGKLIRLRTLYIPASRNPNRLARLMFDSLMTFAVLFRHTIRVLGADAPFEKRECVMKLADLLGLKKALFDRILEYESEDEIHLEAETDETFADYLAQLEEVIKAIDGLPGGP